MPQRRRLKKEEEEKLQQQKKALKKSYQKSYSGSKQVGSSRISDTKKYLLVAAVAGVIIIIVAVQFLVPPEPYCYLTETDFIHATLNQDTQDITFDRIIAWYLLEAKHTTVDCDIMDYYNDTYELELPPDSSNLHAAEFLDDQILYQIAEVSSVLSFATTMENGTDLQMSTWITLSTMETTPTSIQRGVETEVNFKIELLTTVAVNSYNISLDFYNPIVNTTLTNPVNINGSFHSGRYEFYKLGGSLPASSTITLEFNLTVNTTSIYPELNFLEVGVSHLVLNNKLLANYHSEFKESTIDFTGFGMEEDPTLDKSKYLDIVLSIPYYEISLYT